ncbi:MAG: TadE/TadG family type IV pilus assembly protein [Pyrinomonadaceae bacterium]
MKTRRGWGTFTMFRLTKRLRRDERGTQLVELALVAPLMLMLMGATAEFGRFFYTYSTLAKATRVGARYQISQAPGTNFALTKNLVVYGNTAGTGTPVLTGLTTGNVSVVENKNAGGAVQTVSVSISGYGYQPVFDLGKLTKSATLSLAVNVAPSSTMRQLVQ